MDIETRMFISGYFLGAMASFMLGVAYALYFIK